MPALFLDQRAKPSCVLAEQLEIFVGMLGSHSEFLPLADLRGQTLAEGRSNIRWLHADEEGEGNFQDRQFRFLIEQRLSKFFWFFVGHANPVVNGLRK